MVKKSTRKKSKKNRLMIWGKRLILSIILLAAVLAVLLIGARRKPRIAPLGSPAENLAVMTAIGKLSGAMLNPDSKVASRAVVELTPDELNAILANAIRAYQMKNSGADAPVIFAEWRDKLAALDVSLPLPVAGAVNIHAGVRPDLAARKLVLQITGVRAGWLPVPDFLINPIAEQALRELEKSEQYRLAVEVVESLQVTESGNLRIEFLPARISLLLGLLLQR